jgi:hypothetical protein
VTRFIFKIMSLIFFFAGELRRDGVLRSSPNRLCELHTIPLDSLSLFSETPAIVCPFGARRLSQQSHSFFPEP